MNSAMTFEDTTLPKSVIRRYWRLSKEFNKRKNWREMDEQELWNELCFCVLSSNVPFEMAKSAFLQLLTKSLIDIREMGPATERRIARELSRPIYLPRRKNRSFRRYRFPALRAGNLVEAWNSIYGSSTTLVRVLDSHSSGEEARQFLACTVPGLGMKEASHFLRNIKFCDSLAIIDSHIIRFLNKRALVSQGFPSSLSPRRYVELENTMKAIAEDCHLSLPLLDMAIWEYSRSH